MKDTCTGMSHDYSNTAKMIELLHKKAKGKGLDNRNAETETFKEKANLIISGSKGSAERNFIPCQRTLPKKIEISHK